MRKQFRIAAFSAMLFSSYIAGSANADTITYSGHFSTYPTSSAGAFPGTGMAMECVSMLSCSISGGDVETVTLQQFDPSLGPLNSVEFTLTSALAHEPPGFQYQSLTIYLADTTSSNEALATVVETLLVTGALTGDLFDKEFTLEIGCTQIPPSNICSISAGNPAAQFFGSFNDIATSAALPGYIGLGTFEMSLVQEVIFSQMLSNINNPDAPYPYLTSTFLGGWTGDLSVTYTYNVIPIPGALLLFGSGLIGLIRFGTRRTAEKLGSV